MKELEEGLGTTDFYLLSKLGVVSVQDRGPTLWARPLLYARTGYGQFGIDTQSSRDRNERTTEPSIGYTMETRCRSLCVNEQHGNEWTRPCRVI